MNLEIHYLKRELVVQKKKYEETYVARNNLFSYRHEVNTADLKGLYLGGQSRITGISALFLELSK